MHAWEFSKVLHLQRQHGWARFVSMQDHYNLLGREGEREMLPLCADEGIGTIVWSPLARGRLARDSDAPTRRSASDPLADMLYTEESSDRAIIDAVAAIARARGVSRAQVSLARLRRKPVVVAPLVGASKPSRRRAVPPVFGAPRPAGRRLGHRLSRTRPHSWRPGGDGALWPSHDERVPEPCHPASDLC